MSEEKKRGTYKVTRREKYSLSSFEYDEASVSKGIDMLRLDRKLAPTLDKWRTALKANPKDWK